MFSLMLPRMPPQCALNVRGVHWPGWHVRCVSSRQSLTCENLLCGTDIILFMLCTPTGNEETDCETAWAPVEPMAIVASRLSRCEVILA